MDEVTKLMDETEKLLAELKDDLQRKDETYRLIADSKPREDCTCRSCTVSRADARIVELLEKAIKERAAQPGAHPYSCTCYDCFEKVFGKD